MVASGGSELFVLRDEQAQDEEGISAMGGRMDYRFMWVLLAQGEAHMCVCVCVIAYESICRYENLCHEFLSVCLHLCMCVCVLVHEQETEGDFETEYIGNKCRKSTQLRSSSRCEILVRSAAFQEKEDSPYSASTALPWASRASAQAP